MVLGKKSHKVQAPEHPNLYVAK